MISSFLRRVIRVFLRPELRAEQAAACAEGSKADAQASGKPDLDRSLAKNLAAMQALMGHSSDLKIHSFRFGAGLEGAIAFVDGLVDNSAISDAVLRPIMSWQPADEQALSGRQALDALFREVLCAGEVEEAHAMLALANGCLSGDLALFVDGCAMGLKVGVKGWERRAVTEPLSESVVRGPREGFTENLRTNTALLRRKIRNVSLRSEMVKVGRKTRTDICLMYLAGVADPKVIEEVRYRIKALDVDAVLETGYIEEFIEDAPFSPFTTLGYSEKPDVIAGRVLEGRVAILVDGTPFVITAPMLFIESFQTAEDYYTRSLYASMFRMLRYVAYVIAMLLPALYIALTSFHQELIPTRLLLTIANAREGTPFPVAIEMFIMVFAFEVLRESGIRLPRAVGQAISIVGALVMGDAAISAGIVGAPVVITIALTAVAGFMIPMQYDSISILRPLLMIVAAYTGFYGLWLATLAMLVHLSTLTSFGVPYFDGFHWTRNLEDSVVRLPMWMMRMRPKGIAKDDVRRLRSFIPPLRPFERREEGSEEET